mmetsp:Transcript_11187/g.20662  ORF Transcript_11187/g.20662 Transcript_11187/m.20662 type:complete len:243 (-) Transcript_11187:289-1017(-)|eukprot:CAMPEP_0184513150 /NCGR_PEP_ID=MMETSP0198_2-20121128/3272_1 /TAXON_ID=1112570 /ORGANISM="Thraustochytrium sp., Strain LLF1b" /LENGTH=242 /DNA_ID=CAMNT_0026903245 /DNA_START=421 /DNA_END=1149 /DNA_ORIENTATION=-
MAAMTVENTEVAKKMAELMQSVAPQECNEMSESLKVISDALERYAPEQLALSFNGGKDCTVVLHLIRAVLQQKYSKEESHMRFSKLKLVYFKKDDDFPEMLDFVESIKEKYSTTVEAYPSSYRVGLEMLESEGIKAVFMGQRKTDPFGANLEHFSPCSEGWPNIMRINPILNWSYCTVWSFLRGCELEYCKLYDNGYTSLGSIHTTTRNPQLVVEGASDGLAQARPAYELQNGDEFERASRT